MCGQSYMCISVDGILCSGVPAVDAVQLLFDIYGYLNIPDASVVNVAVYSTKEVQQIVMDFPVS